jgi:hypothetical protein
LAQRSYVINLFLAIEYDSNMEGMRKRRSRRRVLKKGNVHPFLVDRLLQRGTYPWRVIRVVLNIHNHNSQRKNEKKLGCCKTLLTS